MGAQAVSWARGIFSAVGNVLRSNSHYLHTIPCSFSLTALYIYISSDFATERFPTSFVAALVLGTVSGRASLRKHLQFLHNNT